MRLSTALHLKSIDEIWNIDVDLYFSITRFPGYKCLSKPVVRFEHSKDGSTQIIQASDKDKEPNDTLVKV